jgi:hypothetical protein
MVYLYEIKMIFDISPKKCYLTFLTKKCFLTFLKNGLLDKHSQEFTLLKLVRFTKSYIYNNKTIKFDQKGQKRSILFPIVT